MTIYARPGSGGSSMSFPSRSGNFIGGKWGDAHGGRYFENLTPVTGQSFCEVPCSDEPTSRKRSTPHTPRRLRARLAIADDRP